MEYSVVKSDFNGFGARILSVGIYFCANILTYKNCGVRIYDIKNGKIVADIEIPYTCAVGDVYSFVVKGLSMEGLGYRFYSDNGEFADPYSRMIKNVKALGTVSVIPEFTEPEGFFEDRLIHIPFSESVFYLSHIKGMTQSDPQIKHSRGTLKAFSEKIPYLKALNVTSVILMPVYSFDSTNNYWGFGDSYYYAVNSAYSYSDNPVFEYKQLVKKFHDNGMEVLMVLAFPAGKTTEFICDVSKYYREKFHIDGFRYIGPCIDAYSISQNPFLRDSKLLFENVDLNFCNSNIFSKYKNIGVFDETFLKNSRRFLKGDDDLVSYISYAIRENAKEATPIRFITDFRSFTLWDMVSYNRKHNELNGEDNRDGTDYNFSWNCGEEGSTSKKKVNCLRYKQVRNASILAYLCQGSPCLLAGDEFLNTRKGNNNPYCQDNEIGWVEYRTDKEALLFNTFLKNLLAFRKRHVILHQSKPLMLFDYMSCKLPDVSFHGEEAWKLDQTPSSREFGIMYCGDYAKQYSNTSEDSVFIAYNLHWEDRRFSLPKLGKGSMWYLLYATDGSTDESFDEESAVPVLRNSIKLHGRTIAILLQKKK